MRRAAEMGTADSEEDSDMASEVDPQGREPQVLLETADFNQARVLEVGCGDGRLTYHYGKVSALVVGLEPNPIRVASAAGALTSPLRPHVSFMRASAMALPVRAGAFDIALFAKFL
jgi:ubiquinone/menaquinone biosynthesis C-methylase UbiE